MELQQRIDALLDHVQKPARYSGGEMNAAAKSWEAADVRFAFCFPDVYEVGMSHLGMKILYEGVNTRSDALCERVFAPWVDMADMMKAQNVALFSLETRRAVKEFDIIGFTLQYELSYTSILEMLSLAEVPIHTKDRTLCHPLVIAGGPCAFNPEPLHAFIDAFVIGDGEVCIHKVIDCVKEVKAIGESRDAILLQLAAIPGVYVPCLYEVTYDDTGKIKAFTQKKAQELNVSLQKTNTETKALGQNVQPFNEGEKIPGKISKCIVRDLDSVAYPEKLVVPFMEIVHDRIMLEIMRGCTRGCRFCQAGMLYRPVRERSVERLLSLAEKLVDSTGYEEMSLSSLSTGDYTHLPELASQLMARFEKGRISLSLPSLRLDGNLQESLAQTQKVRKSSLTFAPEAGTQRLRDVINKGITEADVLETVREAFRGGTSSLKLYFMIGLPTETEDDILGIAEMVRAVSNSYFAMPKGSRPKGLRISVSASSFVPKPFTPFQWAAQDTVEMLQHKQTMLREALRTIKGVVFHWHEPSVSFLEACFARGDRRLADVLYTAYQNGCRFDGWSEHFHYDAWMNAFEACDIDPTWYANRERPEDEILPWSFIDAGVTSDYLLHEKHRAEQGIVTPDCRKQCNGCGLQEVCFTCE